MHYHLIILKYSPVTMLRKGFTKAEKIGTSGWRCSHIGCQITKPLANRKVRSDSCSEYLGEYAQFDKKMYCCIQTWLPMALIGPYLYAVDERSKQKDEQLHGGHAALEEFDTDILILLGRGTGNCSTLVGQESVAAAEALPISWRTLLWSLQKHPVESVQELGLCHT